MLRACHCCRDGACLNSASDNPDNRTNLEDSYSTQFGGDGASEQGPDKATSEEQAICA
jgi:hypothetical protein